MSLQRMRRRRLRTPLSRHLWRKILLCAAVVTYVWALPIGSLAQLPVDDQLIAENASSGPKVEPQGDSTPPSVAATAAAGSGVVAGSTGRARAPASAVPYMLGDLLRGSGSISFVYENVSSDIIHGAVGVEAGGAINLRNAKVADDDNAIPSDRVSYEFNFFKNGEGLVGTSSNTVPTGLPPPLPQTRFTTQEARYDVELHTLQYEKSFADGLFSIEARVPFSSGLSSQLNLSAAQINGVDTYPSPYGPVYALDLTPTPESTLGTRGWQLEERLADLEDGVLSGPDPQSLVLGRRASRGPHRAQYRRASDRLLDGGLQSSDLY